MSRTLHRSMLLGLVLAGLTPVWVRPEVDPATGLPLGVAPEAVRRALAAHPEARAVFVGDPSYVGTVGDVAGLAEAAHEHDVPLVVDAAWAAHFGFHPDLPRHALQLGADVMVTSAHKTLPAWSQAAIVLARTERIDPARLEAGVEATATTSPAGAILASTDAARALLERDGEELLGAAIAATRRRPRAAARRSPASSSSTVPASTRSSSPSCSSATGADGNAVEQDLLAAGLPVESADRDVLVAVVSLADTAADPRPRSPTRSSRRSSGTAAAPRAVVGPAAYGVEPVAVVPPRAGVLRRRRDRADRRRRSAGPAPSWSRPTRPASRSSRPASGSPTETLRALEHARAAGVRIAYAADPTLATLRVDGRLGPTRMMGGCCTDIRSSAC